MTKTTWRRTIADELRDMRQDLLEIVRIEALNPEPDEHKLEQIKLVAQQLRVADSLEDRARSMVVVV